MNATVNWIKRRVSLSSPSSPIIIHQTPPSTDNDHTTNTTTSNHHNNFLNTREDNKISRTSSNESSRSSSGTNNFSGPASVNGVGRPYNSSVHNSSTRLMQHDIIDPSSPLSILAATSRLTTFPYGELQALNARMSMEASKRNAGPPNGLQPNGLQSVNPPNLTNVAAHTTSKPKPRIKEQKAPIKPPPASKSLLPSTVSSQVRQQPDPPTTVNPSMLSTSTAPLPRIRLTTNQRSVTTSVSQPITRRPNISHKKSASLSSTINTRSKRHKPSRTVPSITLPDLPSLPPPPVKLSEPPVTPQTSDPQATGKKRILPARHGHSDILDGEISLLSTPQRLDSTSPPS